MNTTAKLLVVTSLGYARLFPLHECRGKVVGFGADENVGSIVAHAVVGPLDDVVFRLRKGGTVRVEVWSGRAPRHLLTVPEGDALVEVEAIADPDGILTGEVGQPWQ